jgi:hypothetical protein
LNFAAALHRINGCPRRAIFRHDTHKANDIVCKYWGFSNRRSLAHSFCVSNGDYSTDIDRRVVVSINYILDGIYSGEYNDEDIKYITEDDLKIEFQNASKYNVRILIYSFTNL